MIFTWMLYCTAVSALPGLGALALERAVGAPGRPTRGAWAGAVLLCAAFPVALPSLMGLRARLAPPPAPRPGGQLRRLRLAMEVDCDARVLRRRPDVRAYGLLLLEVGRVASSGRVPTLALTEPPSFLERRIRTMTTRTLERSFRRAALPAAVCAGGTWST